MKKSSILFLFIVVGMFCNAQYTSIPDPAFEQALADLGLDGAPPGVVWTNNIDDVQNLNITNKGISDLSGIEDFTGLIQLQCGFNNLTTIDLSQNINLDLLNCESNQLTSLNLSQNPDLYWLVCSSNDLISLDLSMNPALEVVTCNNNQLTDIDLSGSNLLSNLQCSSNNLSVLNLANLPELEYLVCNENNLSMLDLSGVPSLLELECCSNSLSVVDITNTPMLEWLRCNDNQLTDIIVPNNHIVYYIECDGNLLTSIDPILFSTLAYLDCSNNLLTSLDLSDAQWLHGLQCDGNDLQCLNFKNGPTDWSYEFIANNNPSLTCIEVLDSSWAADNWTAFIDPGASFAFYCDNACSSVVALGIEENQQSILFYPNPVEDGLLHVSSVAINASFYLSNGAGQLLIQGVVNETIDLSEIAAGIYFLTLQDHGVESVHKIVVQ